MPYDFRRPIQLSREHSRLLQLGFDSFARQVTTVFTSMLRTVCQFQLLGVQQLSYDEYVASLQGPTYLTKFTADPISGQGLLDVPLRAVFASIDHMLGGPGAVEQPKRALTEIETAVAQALVDRLLGELRYGMASIVEIDAETTGVEYSPQFAQIAGAADVMMVAEFMLRIDDVGHTVSLCLPFTGLLPHLVKAAAPTPVSDRERAKKAQAAALLREQFELVPVDASVRFRPTRLTPGSLTSLRPGDVVRLSHPSTAPLDVVVDDTTFAHATAGAKGPRLAALIVGTTEENR